MLPIVFLNRYFRKHGEDPRLGQRDHRARQLHRHSDARREDASEVILAIGGMKPGYGQRPQIEAASTRTGLPRDRIST